MRADDVQVEKLEETDGVYVENLEGHTKTGKEDELARKDQSQQRMSRVPRELSSLLVWRLG